MKGLRACAAEFTREFPGAKPWIDWWMRPSHASMLFLVATGMARKLWDSLPATTNSAESMHHKIYKMIGRGNTLFYGMEGLVRIAETFERRYNAARRKSFASLPDFIQPAGYEQKVIKSSTAVTHNTGKPLGSDTRGQSTVGMKLAASYPWMDVPRTRWPD